MKKKMLIAFLVFTFLMMAVVPPAANARGGFQRGCLEGILLGGCLGWLFGRHVDVEPAYPPPPPPPPICSQHFREQWVEQWNPYTGQYEMRQIPPHTERVPCLPYRYR